LRELIFATGNPHKVLEAANIIGPRAPGITLLPYAGHPAETGTSFLDNARIKALAAFQAMQKPAFADDSGICVDVMGGAPGIFSASWSSTRSDAANYDLLLAQLKDISIQNRQASFVCTISLIGEDLDVSFTGVWPGHIALAARGTAGFGYDPVFVPDGFQLTAAELEPELKNLISHRAMAMSELARFLTQ
jgi:XTP/dITP diphosphohydrolase